MLFCLLVRAMKSPKPSTTTTTPKACPTTAEVMTVVLVVAAFYSGNGQHARLYLFGGVGFSEPERVVNQKWVLVQGAMPSRKLQRFQRQASLFLL